MRDWVYEQTLEEDDRFFPTDSRYEYLEVSNATVSLLIASAFV